MTQTWHTAHWMLGSPPCTHNRGMFQERLRNTQPISPGINVLNRDIIAATVYLAPTLSRVCQESALGTFRNEALEMHGITRSILLTNVRIWDSNLGTVMLMVSMVKCDREQVQGSILDSNRTKGGEATSQVN